MSGAEKHLEARIMHLLRLKGFWVEKTDAGLVRRGVQSPQAVLTVGFPDIVAFYPSDVPTRPYSFLIEVKTPKGKLSDVQQRTHARLRALGIEPVVMRHEQDVLALLKHISQ